VRKVLDAPDNWKPLLLVSLGYPDKMPRTPTKKSLSELVYLDMYGKRWEKLEGAA